MTDQDRCPTCDRIIHDNDSDGLERPDGQRWCRDHYTGTPEVIDLAHHAAFELVAFLLDQGTEAPSGDLMRDLEEFGCWLSNKFIVP